MVDSVIVMLGRKELSEEVFTGRPDYFIGNASIAKPRSVGTPNDGDRDICRFTHHQFGRCCKFIDDCNFGDLHFAPECIGGASEVDDPCYACAAYGHVSNSSSPSAPKGVRNDDGDINPESVAEAISDSTGRSIGIDWEKSSPPAFNIRKIDAGVGAYKSVFGFANDEITSATENSHRLPFDERFVAQGIIWVNGDETILGLRNYFLRDHYNVSVGEVRIC
jgi:hypothetical protein